MSESTNSGYNEQCLEGFENEFDNDYMDDDYISSFNIPVAVETFDHLDTVAIATPPSPNQSEYGESDYGGAMWSGSEAAAPTMPPTAAAPTMPPSIPGPMNNFEYDSDDNMSHTDGSDPSSGEDSDVMRYQVSIGIIRIVRRERRRHQGDYEGEDHESI